MVYDPSVRNFENEKEKIIVCDKCKGKGKIECSELDDYHNGIYKYWDEVCNHCKGQRLLIKTKKIIVSIKPYYKEKVNKKKR